MEKEPILQLGIDKMIPRHIYNKPFRIRFPDRGEWKDGFQAGRREELFCYTDGSKTHKGIGPVAYDHGSRRKLSFSLGQCTAVFQKEVCPIKACTVENLDRNCRNTQIHILSESQAVIKVLGNHHIILRLVWDCHQSLVQQAKLNRVQVIWVPGHAGTDGNETARTACEHLFIKPEPACGISVGVAKKAIRD
jgi:ribonuclease HI